MKSACSEECLNEPTCEGIMMDGGICSLMALKTPFDPVNQPANGKSVYLKRRLVLLGKNNVPFY